MESPSGLGLQTDIQNGFRVDISRIMAVVHDGVFFLKNRYHKFFRASKPFDSLEVSVILNVSILTSICLTQVLN